MLVETDGLENYHTGVRGMTINEMTEAARQLDEETGHLWRNEAPMPMMRLLVEKVKEIQEALGV